jgi:hypothetical protein
MFANVVVYCKLRFCERGISAEIQKLQKKQQVLNYAKYSNLPYTVLAKVIFFSVFSIYKEF